MSTKRDQLLRALRRVASMADAHFQMSPDPHVDDARALDLVEAFIDASETRSAPRVRQHGKSLFYNRRPVMLDLSLSEIADEFGLAVSHEIAHIAAARANQPRGPVTCEVCLGTGMVQTKNRNGAYKPTGVECTACAINQPPSLTPPWAAPEQDPLAALTCNPRICIGERGRTALRLDQDERLLHIGDVPTDNELRALLRVIEVFGDAPPSSERENIMTMAEAIIEAIPDGVFDRAAPAPPRPTPPRDLPIATCEPVPGRIAASFQWQSLHLYPGVALSTSIYNQLRRIRTGNVSGIRRSDHALVLSIVDAHDRLEITDLEQALVDNEYRRAARDRGRFR